MNVLLNQNIRDRETVVASTMVDMLISNCKSTTEIVPQEVLAHYFGIACSRHTFVGDEASARRILHNVARDLGERRRVADRLNNYIMQSTEELLQAQRKAKKAPSV